MVIPRRDPMTDDCGTCPNRPRAIRNMDMVAIGRVVLTSREHIIALDPLEKGLMGTLLRYPYEVRDEKEYFDEIQDVKVTKDMLDLAKHIVSQKSGEFFPNGLRIITNRL
jgi:DNA end-binding protein Ku